MFLAGVAMRVYLDFGFGCRIYGSGVKPPKCKPSQHSQEKGSLAVDRNALNLEPLTSTPSLQPEEEALRAELAAAVEELQAT